MMFAPYDYSFHLRYARVLETLGHNEQSDYYYKIACEHVAIGKSFFEYGTFLCKMKKYSQAVKYLQKAEKLLHQIRNKNKLY